MYTAHYYSSERRVPGIAIIGFLLVVIGVVSLVHWKQAPKQAVKPDTKIERVDVANVRDNSISVFWRTEKATRGALIYGGSPEHLTSTALDERDTSTDQKTYHNHIVQLKGLQPNSKIYFRIRIDETEVGQADNLPYTAQTVRPIRTNSSGEPVYGDVIRSTGIAEKDAVVLITIGNSMPLLARTNRAGTFLFSLCCVVSSQLGEAFVPAQTDPVSITILAEDGTKKEDQGLFSDLNPISQAFVIDTQISQLASAQTQQQIGTVLSASDIAKKIEPVDLLYPKEGAFIPGTQPLVRGVGEPGSIVKGQFPTLGRLFQVTVDDKRNWLYQPSFPFSPGEHTLEVQTTDAQGKEISFTRSFTILKSGEQVLGEATPSGTLTPTSTPSATVIITPTEVVTFATATPPPPVSGSSIFPLTVLSLVLVVIGAGIILVL